MQKKPKLNERERHLVDARLLLEMFAERNPGTMIPAAIEHIKAAMLTPAEELDVLRARVVELVLENDALRDELEANEDYEIVFGLDDGSSDSN